VPPRLPHSVFDRGDEPDPRFSLANERTFLAWIRTSLALTAGAIAVHAPALDFPTWVRITLSVLLLVMAGVGVAQAWLRWRRTEIAVRTGEPLPGFGGGLVFASGIGLLVISALAASLFTR
jgi:putative membrane protein